MDLDSWCGWDCLRLEKTDLLYLCMNLSSCVSSLLSQLPVSVAMQKSSGSISPAGIFIVAVSMEALMYPFKEESFTVTRTWNEQWNGAFCLSKLPRLWLQSSACPFDTCRGCSILLAGRVIVTACRKAGNTNKDGSYYGIRVLTCLNSSGSGSAAEWKKWCYWLEAARLH